MSITTLPRWLWWLILTSLATVAAINGALDLKQQQLADAAARAGSSGLVNEATPHIVSALIQRCESTLKELPKPDAWQSALRLRGLGPHAGDSDVVATRALLNVPTAALPQPIPLAYALSPRLGLQVTLLEARFTASSSVIPAEQPEPLLETTAELVLLGRQVGPDASATARANLGRRFNQALNLLDRSLRQAQSAVLNGPEATAILILAQALFRTEPLVADADLAPSVRRAFMALLTQLPNFLSASEARGATTDTIALGVERRALVVETLAAYVLAQSPRPEAALDPLQRELGFLVSELLSNPLCTPRATGQAQVAAASGALRALRLARNATSAAHRP